MTQTQRIERLYQIRQTHSTLTCMVEPCAICKEYYAILLASETKPAA